VEELAVVLCEPDDLGLTARLEVGQRGELFVLRLLERRIHGPAVRTAVGIAEPHLDPLDHVVGEGVAELVRVHVRLRGRVAHEVGQEPLDDPVLADDALRPLDPRVGEDRLLLLAALDEAVGLEPLQHLAGGRARDPEHLGHARGDRGRVVRVGPVLADREREEVDRLQVLVDAVPGHQATLAVLDFCRLVA
jgi:hypothetical protein